MTKPLKITLWVLGCFGAIVVAFMVIVFIHVFVGIDASKEDPTELFRVYVAKDPPASVVVQSAAGRAKYSGTAITFRFRISAKDLDALVAGKKLVKTDSWGIADISDLKSPEFYSTDLDMTWSTIPTSASVAFDRVDGLAVYSVFSP